jgi:hypothetical protein
MPSSHFTERLRQTAQQGNEYFIPLMENFFYSGRLRTVKRCGFGAYSEALGGMHVPFCPE